MLKKLSLAVAVASTTFTGLAYAETVETPVGKLDVTMTATLATDWISRGQALNGAPTVQGSFDVAHESGLYVGIWGGSYAGSGGGSEFDYYVGYTGDINEEVSFNLTAAIYNYPGHSEFDDVALENKDAKNDIEYLASLSAYGATVGVKHRTKQTKQTYLHASYDIALPADFGLTFNVGHTSFDKETDGNENFVDYGVTLSRTVAGVNAALSYTSTDLDKDECNAYSCDNNVTFSLSKTF